MVKRKITPLLLAASVIVSGFTGYFINNQPATAITRVDELSDVCSNTWAYSALKNLVEKYNVIEGYPDKTFRGDRAPTRYEMAAALNATIKAMGKDIARLGAEKADKEDLATVAKLQEEFGTELRTLQARSDALEGRASKIEAKNDEQDNRLAILEKLKIYGDVSFGGIADMARNPSGTFTDGISAIGRTRVNLDYTAIEDKGGAIVGPGTIHSRLIAAFGRVAPINAANNTLSSNTFSGSSSIAGDSSLFNEGISPSNLTGISGTVFGTGTITGGNLRANAYIDSAYYSQVLRASIPYMPTGPSWKTAFTLHAGVIPWKDIYFKSPYQGDDNNQFQNTSLQNNPAILQNFTIPRFALQVNQGMGKWTNFKLTTDVSFLDISDAMNGVGFTVEGDLGYNLGFLDKYFCTNMFNLPGNIFGAFYLVHPSGGSGINLVTASTTAPVLPLNSGFGNTAKGFYAGANQEIYKGFGIFGSYALNNSGPTAALLSSLQNGTGTNVIYNNTTLAGASTLFGIREAWTAGAELPVRALPKFITFNKRQRDVIGAGVSFLFPNLAIGSPSNTLAAGAREKVFEIYYKAQIADGFALIPSVQLIGDRSAFAANKTEVLLGLRSSFTF